MLLEHEMAERETRRLARARAGAGLPPDKRLSELRLRRGAGASPRRT